MNMRSNLISQVIIQDRKMFRTVKDRLLVMLAMNINKIRSDRFQD